MPANDEEKPRSIDLSKLSEILTAIVAGLAALFGVFYVARNNAGKSADKNITIADEHEEMAEIVELEVVEELAVAREENKKGQEVADSIEIMKDDTTTPNHTRKRFDFK